MLHVFKRSRNFIPHITWPFSDTSQCMLFEPRNWFLSKKPLEFLFQDNWNHVVRDEITRLVINTRLTNNSEESWYVQNNWVLLIYAFCILRLKALRKFHYAFFGRWFCSWCTIFKMAAGVYRTLWNVSINFLLFYKNNVMLKTDIMLDYW